MGSLTGGHFSADKYGVLRDGAANGNLTMAEWAATPQFEENIVGHGLVGGLASVAGGGSFQSGFLSAGFSDAANPLLTLGDADNVATEAVSGGVGSVLGGGKFANGAETGAFGYLFNQGGDGYHGHADPISDLIGDVYTFFNTYNAFGLSAALSTINPFTSGGGGIYGVNIEYTEHDGLIVYTYNTPTNQGSVGFAPGGSLQFNVAKGDGSWAGLFTETSGSYGIYSGGYFNSPSGQGDWKGVALGWALGPPGTSQTITNYAPQLKIGN